MLDTFTRASASLALVATVALSASALQTRSQPQEFVTWIRAGIVELHHAAQDLFGRLAPAAPLPTAVTIPIEAPFGATPSAPHEIAPAKSKTPLVVQFG